MKLWDMRRAHSGSQAVEMHEQAAARRSNSDYYDYRFPRLTPALARKFRTRLDDDTSVQTYRGHQVFQTLIRCDFAPSTTCQQLVYCGSYDNSVHIYDTLSAEPVKRLRAQSAAVRDVSWHPHVPLIMSSSWDGTVCKWDFVL
eukprot:GILI01019837.1.p1 GENE.GILI01019837.1~~GILI01019837.1.p1  ORF type:complete len:165 (+),score=24.68 GILI01019837.1:67-495(+)